MKKRLFLLAMAMIFVFGMVVNASAVQTIDFVVLGGGEIELTPTGITGTEIPVYAVITTNTLHDGKFEFNAGAGDFPIDVFLNFQATLGLAGGVITVSSPQLSTALLTGTFLDTPFAPFVTPPANNISVFLAVFDDEKTNVRFNNFFGIPLDGWDGVINLSFNVLTNTALSGDVVNTPIPGSLLLMGSGIIGILGIGIRRKSA